MSNSFLFLVGIRCKHLVNKISKGSLEITRLVESWSKPSDVEEHNQQLTARKFMNIHISKFE